MAFKSFELLTNSNTRLTDKTLARNESFELILHQPKDPTTAQPLRQSGTS